jgi:hypothetical protein
LIVSGKNIVPLGLPKITYLAAMKLLQITPILLTVLSVEQLLDRMLKVIFLTLGTQFSAKRLLDRTKRATAF